jgi:hypothetical protein
MPIDLDVRLIGPYPEENRGQVGPQENHISAIEEEINTEQKCDISKMHEKIEQ